MQLKDFCFCQFRGYPQILRTQKIPADPMVDPNPKTPVSFFPRHRGGGSTVRGSQLFEGGEQVSVAELQGRVHLLHIRELPPEVVARPLPVLLTVAWQGKDFISLHFKTYSQCSGSMAFWTGSGSADPCLWLMNSDPAIFITDLQDANKASFEKKKFFCLQFFEGTFTSFFKDKKSKRSQKTVGIKVFLTIFAC
jgi:hypothetical protein